MAAASSTERAAIVAEVKSWLGTPYHHQAARKGAGCDCLGLVRGVWSAIYGTDPERPPAYTSDWAEVGETETLLLAAHRHMIEISPAEAAAGDMLMFRWRAHLPAKHVGILITADRMVHAYDRVGVTALTLTPAWRRQIAAAFRFPSIEGAR